jgi:hypothetical protein
MNLKTAFCIRQNIISLEKAFELRKAKTVPIGTIKEYGKYGKFQKTANGWKRIKGNKKEKTILESEKKVVVKKEPEKIKRGFVTGGKDQRGHYYEIYVNPSEYDLKEINKNAPKEDKDFFRGYITENGDLYIWDVNVLHRDALNTLSSDVFHNEKYTEDYSSREFKYGISLEGTSKTMRVNTDRINDSYLKLARNKNPSIDIRNKYT